MVWGKELYIDSTQVKANADLDSLTPRFAVEAREAIQQHLGAFRLRKLPSRKAPRQRARRHRVLNLCRRAPSLSPQRLCLWFSLRYSEKNFPSTMRHAMTGLRKRGGNSGKSMASISGQRIFESVPPIQMPH